MAERDPKSMIESVKRSLKDAKSGSTEINQKLQNIQGVIDKGPILPLEVYITMQKMGFIKILG